MEENAYDIEVHTEVKKLEFMAGGGGKKKNILFLK